MATDKRGWKGAFTVSVFLILIAGNAAAFDMDSKMSDMKADMQTTFQNVFGTADTTSEPEDDSQDTTTDNSDTTDETTNIADTGDTSDTTSEQHTWGWSDDSNEDSSDESSEPSDEPDDSDDSTDHTWGWSDDSNEDASEGDDTSDESTDDRTSGWGHSDSGEQDQTDDRSDDRDALTFEEQTEQIVHDLLNEERAQRGLSPLSFDSDLWETANYKSQDMADRDYFAHRAPTGERFQDIYSDHGVSCRISHGGSIYLGGENLAKTWFDRTVRTGSGGNVYYEDEQELAEGLVRQWMNSDGHRQAILRPYYDNHGIGVVLTNSNQVYATSHFC